ncbi:Spherulation-specific family 4-domain-containing protein [Mycena pura]|uniref:Spherulation-specific family 4-domain-containing protein n=1 Tax=Mycena pura TaxID=153505 RepID=A0AAD6V1E6_9AGAR|nr:Spherulation-specific family 4-domain-containing protein [Mycena pura]
MCFRETRKQFSFPGYSLPLSSCLSPCRPTASTFFSSCFYLRNGLSLWECVHLLVRSPIQLTQLEFPQVLLPLYVFPGSKQCEAWRNVTEAITAYPTTQWYIVINPNNGPGPLEPSSEESLYQNCVAALPSSDNQIVMGFIKTTEGNVTADIDTYAGWDVSSRPNGIFFDNISSTESMLGTYQGYVSHAKDRGFSFIGLDAGRTVPSSFFSLGDLVNTYQNNFSTFDPKSLTGTLSKQSVYLTNAPTTASSYTSIISTLESKGVAAVYIANVNDTRQDLPVQLSEFVSEVASAGVVRIIP